MEKEIKQTNRQYLALIAERIFSERPSTKIILNTLIDIEKHGYGRGYQARTADSRKFKEAQETRRTSSWNNVKDAIADKCSKATIENTNETQPE